MKHNACKGHALQHCKPCQNALHPSYADVRGAVLAEATDVVTAADARYSAFYPAGGVR